MLRMLLGEYAPTARLSGQTLILSLPDALTPVVWTLDIVKDGHGALSVHEDAPSGHYLIVFSGSKKNAPVIEVARYAQRARAVRALSKAITALERHDIMAAGPAASHGEAPAYAAAPQNRKGGWFITFLGIAAIVVLFLYGAGGIQGLKQTSLGWMMAGKAAQSAAGETAAAQQTRSRPNPPADAVGVPMDADSFFGGQ